MRIRLFLLLASVSFVSAGFTIQACGGTESSGPTPDSGVAETSKDSGAKDASVADAADAAPQCDPKNDFLAAIPDASIADGASSTGVCLGCVKSKCQMEVGKCGADCICQGVAGKLLDCYAKTQDVIGCAGQLGSGGVPPATQAAGGALFLCVTNQCKDECGTAAFQDAGDGG